MTTDAADSKLLDQVRSMGWYHSLELAPGVETRGVFDLRPYVSRYGLPERMDGMRVLEVGTWDGFWAFEMERRGAQVTALDLDWERDLDWPPRRRPKEYPPEPRGRGFVIAKELLGSSVERVNCSVYHALPEDLGQFDMVFCGTVIIHLRDQLLALERIAGLTKPGGFFISAEEYDPLSGLAPFPVSRYRADRDSAVVFWQPSIRTWKRMMWTAGFDRVKQHGRFSMKSNEEYSVRHVVLHAFKDPE